MEKFTIEEIKNYLLQKDSIRDIIHNLSEQNIKKANKTISFTLKEIIQSDANWDEFCDKYGVSEWAVNEGAGDNHKHIFISDAKKYNLI